MDYNKCFSLFNSSYIDKEIKKNVLLNNIKNKEDREIIEKFVENVYIKYCIKAKNINKEAEDNFSEIEIIEININNYRTIYDIYGILLSIIPYPILAIFRYNNRISLAVSNRILSEEKNNKGKIFTSYLIKEESVSDYLKVDINNCITLKDIYKQWILNVENVETYYEKIDSVMQIIEKGLHIKSEEVLERLESYIAKYCGTYNMKPKGGWKSKLEKYSDSPIFIKKVETHLLWEYLSENAFFKNKLMDFSSWKDFKESCSYDSLNDLYYSQYNRMLNDEGVSGINKYMLENATLESYNENTFVKEQKNKLKYTKEDTPSGRNPSDKLYQNKECILKLSDEKIMNIVQKAKNNGNAITYDELAEQLGDSFTDEELDKVFEVLGKEKITILKDKEILNQNDEKIESDYYIDEDIRDELRNDKDFMTKIEQINNNTMILKFNSVSKWDFLDRDKEYGLIGILEHNDIQILQKDEFNMEIIGEFNNGIFEQLELEYEDGDNVIQFNHAPLRVINHDINVLESNNVIYYIANWKLHICNTSKEKLKKFDQYMRQIRLAYNISQIENNEKKTVIEYTYEDIEKNELRKPLAIYMNNCIKKEDKNIVIQINNIRPHVMLYLSNIIRTLNKNNNVEHKDFIAILKERSLFYDVWEYLNKNDIKYIFEWKLDIEKIPKDILKQIEGFLQSFKVKYNIEKVLDDIILNMYPEDEEVIGFVTDVLELNNIWYIEDYELDNIASSGTSLWMFSVSKEEKEKICEMLKKPDQGIIDRLKKLGAPEFIIKNEESGPTKCTYGVITFENLQSQIENILQSLKLKYCIMDKNQKIIKNYDNPK